MRTRPFVLFAALLAALLAAVSASADPVLFTPGTWKLEKAYCTNPAYVPTPEENAFNDALATGFITDRYLFTEEAVGIYETTWTADIQTRCVGRAPMRVEYLAGARAKRAYGAMKWTHVSPDPNVTIECGGGEGPFHETTRYEVSGDLLYFAQDSSPQCGEVRMRWRRE